MNLNNILFNIIMSGIPLVFGITLHEAAHGFVAKLRGDMTAYNLGRVTLNPVSHIDPIGTILIPIVLVLLSMTYGVLFIFGWAKPVPINFNNLKNPKLDMALVALAGPIANFMMVILWAVVYKYDNLHPYIQQTAFYGIMLNVLLMLLNLIPIPPLDGSRIVSALLSDKVAHKYNSIQKYGFLILLGLMIIPFKSTSLLFYIINPFIHYTMQIIQLIVF